MATTTPQGHGLGHLPDRYDDRDLRVDMAPSPDATLPASVDLRGPYSPPIWNQGRLGACTAHSVGAAWEFAARKAGHDVSTPSRLFVYWHERALEGTIDTDSGAEIRDGFRVIAKGVPPETDWPYDVAKFAVTPPARAEQDATHRALRYMRLDPTERALCGALAQGYPVSFGFVVFESMESPEVASTGVVPMPADQEQQLGGHAVLAVGYDLAAESLLVRNSWGASWGDRGYFTLPFGFLSEGYVSDCWCCEVAE